MITNDEKRRVPVHSFSPSLSFQTYNTVYRPYHANGGVYGVIIEVISKGELTNNNNKKLTTIFLPNFGVEMTQNWDLYLELRDFFLRIKKNRNFIELLPLDA